MPEKELTSVQRNVLLTLMISADPLAYKTVKNSLTAAQRNDLRDRGLIEVNGSPMELELTQKGHDRAVAALSMEQPERSGTNGLVLVTTLGFVRRLLEQTGTEPRDLFRLRLPTAPVTMADTDLDERIRKAYASLVTRPGDYVMLEDLRESLPEVSRRDLDAALVDLNRARDVSLVPESNQKVLTEEQRVAAVSIGNQAKHLIAISA
jgi:hypothetical protein